MIHLSTYNTSYGQKKGHESKCKFDSRSLKVVNRPYLDVCKWRVTYHWKALNKGYNFASYLFKWRFSQEVMGLQNEGNPNFETLDLGILRKITFTCNPYG